MQYAIQFTQGGYKRDFDTVEGNINTDADAYGFTGLSVSTNAPMSSLTSATSFLSSLPAIGTSATSKLNGVLYDAAFFLISETESVCPAKLSRSPCPSILVSTIVKAVSYNVLQFSILRRSSSKPGGHHARWFCRRCP